MLLWYQAGDMRSTNLVPVTTSLLLLVWDRCLAVARKETALVASLSSMKGEKQMEIGEIIFWVMAAVPFVILAIYAIKTRNDDEWY